MVMLLAQAPTQPHAMAQMTGGNLLKQFLKVKKLRCLSTTEK